MANLTRDTDAKRTVVGLRIFSHWLLLLLHINYSCCWLPLVHGAELSCTVCRNGTSIPLDHVSTLITVPGYEQFVQTCGDLQDIASMVAGGSEMCIQIQSIGTLCGCPIPADACSFCPNGETITEEFSGTTIPDFPLEQTQLPPNCGLVEAVLHSVTANSDTCTQVRQFAEFCGCPALNKTGETVPTPKDDPRNDTSCQLCRDGGELGFPDKDLSPFLWRNAKLLKQSLSTGVSLDDNNESSLSSMNCRLLAGWIASMVLDGTEQCSQAQTLFGGLCGCAPVNDGYCRFCPNDKFIPNPDKLIYSTAVIKGFPQFDCTEFNLTSTQTEESSNTCLAMRQFNFLCGCNDGDRYYLGADSEVKRAFLAWIPRISGLASLLGSLWIMIDVFRNKQNCCSTFHQLLFAISLYDCFSSSTWIVSTAAIMEYYYRYGEPTGVYGAIGNEASCKAQGFFFQLGFTGNVCCNIVLSCYYVLVIAMSYGEGQFRSVRKWFHGIPIAAALAWALAGIPYYDGTFLLCSVPPYPLAPSQALVIAFLWMPCALAFVVCCFTMCWIFWVMRKRSTEAQRPRLTGRDDSSRLVFASCLIHEKNLQPKHEQQEQQEQPQQQDDKLANVTTIPPVSCQGDESFSSLPGTNQQNNDGGANPAAIAHQSPHGGFTLWPWNKERRQSRIGGDGVSGDRARSERSSLHSSTMWEAIFYMASFCFTFICFLAAPLNSNSENYWFWVLMVTISPLQGFLNLIVYMRQRWAQAWIRQRTRKKSGSRNARQHFLHGRNVGLSKAWNCSTTERNQENFVETPLDLPNVAGLIDPNIEGASALVPPIPTSTNAVVEVNTPRIST